MVSHPLLDQLDSALRDLVAAEAIQFRGEWTSARRRAYKSRAQADTRTGPYVDVVDFRWRGALTSAEPIGGIGFLLSRGTLEWVKAPELAPILPVEVSLSAFAEFTSDGATFTTKIAGGYLPGVPVPVNGDLASVCTLGPDVVTTGRVTCLARVDSTAFFVLLLERRLLKVGRKRLWRMRDDIAAALSPAIRDMLTHRRTGMCSE